MRKATGRFSPTIAADAIAMGRSLTGRTTTHVPLADCNADYSGRAISAGSSACRWFARHFATVIPKTTAGTFQSGKVLPTPGRRNGDCLNNPAQFAPLAQSRWRRIVSMFQPKRGLSRENLDTLRGDRRLEHLDGPGDGGRACFGRLEPGANARRYGNLHGRLLLPQADALPYLHTMRWHLRLLLPAADALPNLHAL
jgi:hypothetical protein